MPLDALALSLAQITIAAGGSVASIYARGCSTRWKADGSPVTEADLAAERLILERLAHAFPGVPVVAEESVAAGPRPELGPRFLLGRLAFEKGDGFGLILNGHGRPPKSVVSRA